MTTQEKGGWERRKGVEILAFNIKYARNKIILILHVQYICENRVSLSDIQQFNAKL